MGLLIESKQEIDNGDFMAIENQKIVFLRHAHREKIDSDPDNGLSPKGKRQVEELILQYRSEKLPPSKIFWTSPKKRCVETLDPIAHLALAPMKIEKLLLEKAEGENERNFQRRIEEVLEKAKDADANLYLCSHGDLLPEAIEVLTGQFVTLSKGEAVVAEFSNSRWKIK